MQTQFIYSAKAEKYAQYRWDYTQAAIETIFSVTGLSHAAIVADIGSGTGILTRHFLNRVKQVFAVELNPEMRRIAENALGHHSAFHSLDACAEATTLPDHSVDLITVAQAIHWFEPEHAKQEFHRILKPDGWLAILRNYSTDTELNTALESIHTAPNHAAPSIHQPGKDTPVSFYYGQGQAQQFSFPFTNHQTWEAFLGSLLSASYSPAEDSPHYPQFECAAGNVFARFATHSLLTTHGVTELYIGRIN